jgi:uncharacterized protein (UPF0276 family)
LAAALPLFRSGRVGGIEWAFDSLYKNETLPEWFEAFLHEYGRAGRLVGHGVFFSIFSGKWLPEQAVWLKKLAELCQKYEFNHISEHFGFMTGADFHKGAPIGLPLNSTTLRLGRDRLFRIFEACGRPVGLENLAFACSLDEVEIHGEFLEKLLAPVNGFLILDLHNLYCQIQNFGVDFDEIIEKYPLERVREIHVSGGSWEPVESNPAKKIRRDTHDDAVPESVFLMLEKVISRCPNLKFVVLEQLSSGLQTENSQKNFQKDFKKVEKILGKFDNQTPFLNDFLPKKVKTPQKPVESEWLSKAQKELSEILENAANWQTARQKLAHSSLADSDWKIENWQPEMLETAVAIAQKWKNGWEKE